MVRRKIKIKRIENATTRQVTFSKRRGGLLKKAHDLSVLCEAETAVIIFSSKGKLFQFASSSMQGILEKYIQRHEELSNILTDCDDDHEVERLMKYMENLKLMQRHLMGEDLGALSLKELVQLEEQIHMGLVHIRAKKGELLIEQLEDIKDKVAEAQKATSASSNLLSNLVRSQPGATHFEQSHDVENTFAHQSSHPNLQVPPTNEASPQIWFELCEQSNQNPFPKRSIMSEDLNRSPGWLG